jgi:4-amino-4-deoxy-L-arabinose transferase-like glycosyltransferase
MHASKQWIGRAAIPFYIGLCFLSLRTREPWCDEAWFNSPALTLATKGYMGTPYLDPGSNIGKPQIKLDGIDHYTYWMPPLYMVTQAAWIKIAGFDITRVRLTSMLWGLAALLAWWVVADRLAGQLAASLMIVLLGVDYNWIYAASDARMEMLCAALGTAGLALFLVYRGRAVLAANAAIAAACLTHPMGVVYGVAMVVMVLVSDRGLITLRNVALGMVPYLVALAVWGVYIAQAPRFFFCQFVGNASDRGPGITHPFAALWLELTHRYGESFGLASWTSGPARIKILVLMVYVAGLIYVTVSRNLRSIPGVHLAWVTASSVLIFFWLFEGSKTPLYLPHVLPWLCLLAAIAITDIARHSRAGAAAVVIAVIAVQCLSTVAPARRDPYHRLYTPAMNFLREHAQPKDTIMADAAVGFALGFDQNVTDDAWLGYATGKKCDWLVITPVYASMIESMPQFHPDVARHVKELMAGYALAYSNETYRIYRR